MNEYLLLFRMDITSPEAQPSPEQMDLYMMQWERWINSIADQNKLAEGGNHLSAEGKVLSSGNKINSGPYTVNKESVAGYIIILASNLDEAVSIAQDCPILLGEGTSVEVRRIASV